MVFELDNKGEIVPGAYIEVFLLTASIDNAIVVPVSALTEEQGLYFVYLRLDEEGYKKQEVTVGNSDVTHNLLKLFNILSCLIN